jgi:hypothetical protein
MGSVTSDRLAVGLLFVAIGVLACLAPAQGDTWWLLRAGQDIWETGRVPLADAYSHTAAGRYWPNHEPLTELVFYLAHTVGGMPLIAALGAASIVAAWALSWRLTTGSFELRFLTFAASLTAAVGSWALRPQLFTMFCFAATCTLLTARRWFWLPPLFVIWANLHGAVALGLVAVGAGVAAESWTRRTFPRGPVLALAGCALATLATPLGWGLWTFIIESMERSRVNEIIEWRAPGLSPAYWAFWALAAALPIVAWRARRDLDGRAVMLVAIALAVLPLAARAVRNVPIFLLVAVPALTAAASAGRVVRAPKEPPRENVRVNAVLMSAAVVCTAVFVGLLWAVPPAQLGWRPISDDAARAIANCPDPLYNTFEQGGALIWFVPGKRVFLDNRQDPYPADLLIAGRTAEITGETDDLFARYGIRCAVVPVESPIAARLAADGGWAPTYADAEVAVFTRRAISAR